MFAYEKEIKNSVRYKEVPDEGTAPIVGTLYVQKWFAGDSKSIEITIDRKDWLARQYSWRSSLIHVAAPIALH